MRSLIVVLSLLIFPTIAADAQVSVGFSIGINVPVYPQLVTVPGYPVYYDPDLDSNYFFYDGQYWVYTDDGWYTSDWYNGPWTMIEPEYVPLFILRVPVRYYHRPPVYFHDWHPDAPPHWGEHWGHDWEARHRDWDHWDRRSAPPPAPLPTYQRQYSGDRYPHGAEQRSIRDEHYHFQPHETVKPQSRPSNSTGKAPNNIIEREEPLHPPVPMQRQHEMQPRPERNAPSRSEEQSHERIERRSAQPERMVRPPSPPPANREEHSAPPPHAQPHPAPQHPPQQHQGSPHGDRKPPHKDHEDHG